MLFLLLIHSAIGSPCVSIDLPDGLTFEYNSSEGDLHATIHVPPEIFHAYGWVGVGFKHIDMADDLVAADMVDADIVTIIFEGSILGDRWSDENDYPPLDVDLGGTSFGESGPVMVDLDGRKVFSWSRYLDTGDSFDILFELGTGYTLIWAYGPLDENGDIAMHVNAGSTEFILIDCSQESEGADDVNEEEETEETEETEDEYEEEFEDDSIETEDTEAEPTGFGFIELA